MLVPDETLHIFGEEIGFQIYLLPGAGGLQVGGSKGMRSNPEEGRVWEKFSDGE